MLVGGVPGFQPLVVILGDPCVRLEGEFRGHALSVDLLLALLPPQGIVVQGCEFVVEKERTHVPVPLLNCGTVAVVATVGLLSHHELALLRDDWVEAALGDLSE